MGFYEPAIYVDSFDTDADGFIRARREDVYCRPIEVGQVVSVDCDELGTVARVVRFEGHPDTGVVVLQELAGDEWIRASADLSLSHDDWCAIHSTGSARRHPSGVVVSSSTGSPAVFLRYLGLWSPCERASDAASLQVRGPFGHATSVRCRSTDRIHAHRASVSASDLTAV